MVSPDFFLVHRAGRTPGVPREEETAVTGKERQMRSSLWILLLCCLCEFSTEALAVDFTVVTTGDSLTAGSSCWGSYGYSPYLQASITSLGGNTTVYDVSSPGCMSWRYVGAYKDPYTDTYHNYATDVLNLDPDVICFLLGTCDAGNYEPAHYCSNITGVFSAYASFVNGRGEHPSVIVATIIPILTSGREEADRQITDDYNPWLRQQAGNLGFILLDLSAEIQGLPDWTDLYKVDGVHLKQEGRLWMAERFAQEAILVIPEPTSLILLASGALAILRRKRN